MCGTSGLGLPADGTTPLEDGAPSGNRFLEGLTFFSVAPFVADVFVTVALFGFLTGTSNLRRGLAAVFGFPAAWVCWLAFCPATASFAGATGD